jgi:translation initiation factor 1 (eIF-1/SUI1)
MDKKYILKKAVALLREVKEKAIDKTPQKVKDEKFEIQGDLFNEIYNFLQNNNL